MAKKVAIITAASKGMGAACARELSRRGYQLVLMARSNAINDLAEELGAVGIQVDVTNPVDLKKLVAITLEEHGRVDAVINSSGHPARGDLLELSDDDWHAALDLMLLNIVRIARLTVPAMAEQGGGAFVNISTFAAREPSLDYPLSSAIRAGTAAFTKLLADRYAGDNIRMNSVLPGYIDSFPMEAKAAQALPMHRPGSVNEIAKTAAFLISDDAGYITGQSIVVDGALSTSI